MTSGPLDSAWDLFEMDLRASLPNASEAVIAEAMRYTLGAPADGVTLGLARDYALGCMLLEAIEQGTPN